MPFDIDVSDELLFALHSRKILLGYNCPAPKDGTYGWLKRGQRLHLHHTVALERNCGLYAGPYVPFVGGQPSCGLCSMGAFSYSYSGLPDGLTVGRSASISTGLRFIDSFHPLDTLTTSAITFRPHNHLYAEFATDRIRDFAAGFRIGGMRPYPTLGHDVWIGANVTLAMGIRLGTGCVVAANSVVTRDVPPYAIVAGNPARQVRLRVAEETSSRLLDSAWWDLDPRAVFELDFTCPERALEALESGALAKFDFQPTRIEAPAPLEA